MAGYCSLESWECLPIFPTSTKVSGGEGGRSLSIAPIFFFSPLFYLAPQPVSDPWTLHLCVLRDRRVQLLTGHSFNSLPPSLSYCKETVVPSLSFHLQGLGRT